MVVAVNNIVSLGNVAGAGYGTDADSINNNGQVAGYSVTNVGGGYATEWRNGNPVSLGNLTGYIYSSVSAINDQNQMVGVSATGVGYPGYATLWQNGTAIDLAGTQNYSAAFDINNQGQVVGSYSVARYVYHAMLWQNGTMTDLGTLAGADNARSSAAHAINDSGQVVGQSDTAAGTAVHAALWQNGTITDLGCLASGYTSIAYAINNTGLIVGDSTFSSNSVYTHAVLWQNGMITDLGTLSGDEGSCASAIDSAGDIVGFSQSGLTFRAVLWRSGAIIDLNSLLPANSGWNLVDATGINDHGQIVGDGYYNGLSSGFVLSLSGLSGSVATPAQAIVQSFQSGTLSSAVTLTTSSSDLLANLDGLQSVAAAGKLSSITLSDGGTPVLSLTATQLAQDAGALHAITTKFNLTVSGASTSFIPFLIQQDLSGRGLNGIAADYAGMAPTGGNSVVGFQNATFTSGVDTVLLDNARSHYAIQVAANGTTTIQDIGAGDANYGQTVTVSGESYIVFNGAKLGASMVRASGAPTYPNDMLFIQNPANAQLAQFYAAILQRIPDLAGLEYWQNSLAAGTSLTGIAQAFINTSVFATLIGADPSTLTHSQYVSDLYHSILGRPADPGGLAYWVAAMDAGMSQAAVLVNFTSATAAISAVNAFGGTSAGWLVNPSVIGGYADTGVQMSAQSVLNGAASSHFYNLSLIDPSTVTSAGLTAGGVTVTPGAVSLSAGAAGSTVYLSGAFTQVTAANSGNTIHDGAGADTITVSGANNFITVGSATTDTLNLSAGTNSFVFNYAVGKGSLLAVSGIAHPGAATLLNGTTTAVQGSSLTFGSSPVFVNIGAVGGGSTTEVVAAANKAYAVADSTGEHVIFLGTDSAGDTAIWSFHSGADNHQVIASELTLVATLIGVPASSLTAAELA